MTYLHFPGWQSDYDVTECPAGWFQWKVVDEWGGFDGRPWPRPARSVVLKIYAGIQEKYVVGINIWEISTGKNWIFSFDRSGKLVEFGWMIHEIRRGLVWSTLKIGSLVGPPNMNNFPKCPGFVVLSFVGRSWICGRFLFETDASEKKPRVPLELEGNVGSNIATDRGVPPTDFVIKYKWSYWYDPYTKNGFYKWKIYGYNLY